MTFLSVGLGPIVAQLVTRFGHRSVTLVGVLIALAGFLSAGVSVEIGFPPNISILHITAGLMGGLGFGLMYLPAMDILCKYFDRNLGLAMGIAASGSGIGAVVLSPAVYHLDTQFGFGVTLLVLGVLLSPGVFFAALFTTPPSNQDKKDVEKEASVPKNVCSRTSSLFQLYGSILLDPKMALLLLSHFLVHISTYTGFLFTGDRAHQMNIEKQYIPMIFSTIGISDCLGRIIFGKVLDVFREKSFLLTTIILIVHTGVLGASTFMPGLTGQLIFACLFGLSFGSYVSSTMVLLKIIRDDIIRESFGLCLFVFAIASILTPGIVGPIFDTFGSYRLGYLSAGGIGMVGALLTPVISYLNTRDQNNTKK